MRLELIEEADRRPYIAKKVREKIDRYVRSIIKREDWKHRIGWGREDLGGWCAIAAASLETSFKRAGYPAEMRKGRVKKFGEHCWVVSGDHIYDITATQFGKFPKVYITPISDQKVGYSNGTKNRNFSFWPSRNQPYSSRVDKFSWRPRA